MIKRRNIDPSLVQWIMTVTGLGPGIGEIKWVVPAKSSTSNYRNQLESMGVDSSDMFTLPSLAYAATTAYRNDVVLVMPGAYAETAEIAWSKQNTHLIGLGGPNIGGDYSEPNVVIYSVTANVGSVITVTGANCQFQNFVIENNVDDADNLTAFTLNKYGCYFRNVAFHGLMQSTQCSTAAAAALYIDSNGMYPLFENCIIGQNVWSARTGANQGVLRFTSTTGRPNGGIFRNCQFLSTGDTEECVMVAMPDVACCGRGWYFDNCVFIHTDVLVGGAHNLNQVFYTVGGQKDIVTLHHCMASGIDAWTDGAHETVLADMAVPAVTGGLGIEPT